MKFEVTTFNTLEVMPRTRIRDAWTNGRTDVRTDGQGDSSISLQQVVDQQVVDH